jgi:hypothetical protein
MYLVTFRSKNLTSGIVTFAINLGVRVLYRSEGTFAAMVNDSQREMIDRFILLADRAA